MRTGIITKLTLVALLCVLVGGCRKQDKPGEAFVVLKSGEVIYMADMEVVCLKPSFKADFKGWKTDCESQDKSLVRGIETSNPVVKTKLKEIDDRIAELDSGLSGDEKKIFNSLASAIEAERDRLVAEMTRKNDAREEYKQIVTIEKRIKELVADVDTRADDMNKNLRAEILHRTEELILWQNRHGISPQEGQNLIELEEQQKARVAQLNENLRVFNAGGAEAKSLVQEETRKRASELNQTLGLLNSQRRELLQDAAERARSELKAECRQKFYELIRKDAVAAVRTGSKGDFIIPGEATYLYAEKERDNGEKLAWLVRVDSKSQKIKMSVSNAAFAGGVGDFDRFWMMHWTLAE